MVTNFSSTGPCTSFRGRGTIWYDGDEQQQSEVETGVQTLWRRLKGDGCLGDTSQRPSDPTFLEASGDGSF